MVETDDGTDQDRAFGPVAAMSQDGIPIAQVVVRQIRDDRGEHRLAVAADDVRSAVRHDDEISRRESQRLTVRRGQPQRPRHDEVHAQTVLPDRHGQRPGLGELRPAVEGAVQPEEVQGLPERVGAVERVRVTAVGSAHPSMIGHRDPIVCRFGRLSMHCGL